VDFHGQRTTYITGLALAGVSPAKAQKLARHSDVNLTLRTYARLQVEDLMEEVEKLPALNPENQSEPATTQFPAGAIESVSDGTDLRAVVDAWPGLREHIRQAILALVAASTERTPPEEQST
jgi:hypothetical protein